MCGQRGGSIQMEECHALEGIICIVGIWQRGTGPTSSPGFRAAVSSLFGRRVTTVGGTVLAGK